MPLPPRRYRELDDVDFMVKDKQEVRRWRRMGYCPVQLYRRVRHLHAAWKRRQHAGRVPYDSQAKDYVFKAYGKR